MDDNTTNTTTTTPCLFCSPDECECRIKPQEPAQLDTIPLNGRELRVLRGIFYAWVGKEIAVLIMALGTLLPPGLTNSELERKLRRALNSYKTK